ncbi:MULTISPECIES: alkaline phosphatase family protein [unclassified Curtobacterium]|uniref:alkaline phosphatase family protein n=1 Tax=unclassified Curtobacterium TaxID=257496 RepID=UPI000FBD294A|nr:MULTISPECIES: alkaline phosphatase family protein [unclassified Curtobacterium]ROQ18719.1 type I phosphodiesterase/nucleotide pyrophosphatase [Curtobacterium sp. PhB171]ROQ18985.1 type I phosphodiesterase/nucleotide pyrophosphatase [Curtobacterium sp. PhB170]ROS32471.1 type I phosphodiesterase/nucleotide pyrophosphatase [Curtobacterium sp. PhB131]ROS74213.1 type I phosphodiesterase/nucleotide pyrophosphatase [Curtobacterium sp. PhB141]
MRIPRTIPIAATAIALAASGLATGIAAAPAATAATPAAAAAASSEHVVVIGIDGALFDRIAAADAPNLDAMIASGYSSKTWLYAAPMAQTLSGPGWATNLTGVWPDKHKVLSNTWGTTSDITKYPDFLTRLERANSALTTYADASWNPIVDGSVGTPLVGTVDERYAATSDADAAADAVSTLRSTGPNASFVHFDDVDHAGHSYGAASQQYLDAISEVDGYVGQLRAAVQARTTYSSEQWSFIVTADHGHTDAGGHGGSTPAERSAFIIKTGPGITKQTPAIRPKNVDIAADVLATFGVARPAELDGRPLATASTDPFDTMVGALKPRVDETGIPASTLGWTKSMPTGWSVDNTGMGTGGVTEWAGWTLTDDDFWTQSQRDQTREANVRERGVFAVADSDEWADKTHTGTFSSRITSQPYSVAGKTSATVSFGNHYRQEGAQQATVLVSFDGGAFRQVASYTTDQIAQVASVPVTVPSGAKQVRVQWALTNADNDWYWAIDEPQVR